MYVGKKSMATRNTTSSLASACGPTQPDLLAGLTIEGSGPPPARASRSRMPESVAVLTIQGIRGPTHFDSYEAAAPVSSWASKFQARLATVGSTECSLIWKAKATPAKRSMYRLAASTRHISVTASFGLPREATWPTVTSLSSQNSNRPANSRSQNITREIMERATWATPKASAAGPDFAKYERSSTGASLQTQMAASTWVTPSARDWKDSVGMATQAGDRSRIDQLPRQMSVNSPNATADATVRSGPNTNGSSATTEKRGAPNPQFAFWLMGLDSEYFETVALGMLRRRLCPVSKKSTSVRRSGARPETQSSPL